MTFRLAILYYVQHEKVTIVCVFLKTGCVLEAFGEK